MLLFGLCSLLMISQAGWWTQTPSATPLQPKNEMLIFVLCSTSDDQPGWSMDSNPICHPSPAKKNEMLIFVLCSTSDVGQTGQWTQTPSTTPLQPKKWNASFMDYTQLLMIGRAEWWTQTPSTIPLQPKNEMLIFGLCSLLMIGWASWWTWTPSATPLLPKKWNAHFSITFNFWWSAMAGQWTQTPSATPLQPIKWNATFWIVFTSDDQPGWLMNSNPICHPSPANKMKCSYFDYVQLLMISQAGWWTQTPSATPLQPIKWNALFGLCSLLMISQAGRWTWTPVHPPSPAYKMKCSCFDYVQLLMIGCAGRWTRTPSTTALQPKKNAHFWNVHFWWSAGLVDELELHLQLLSCQKNEMLIFWLRSTYDDWPGWSMDWNPICHPSPAKKWNATFWITFNFWWSAGLVNGLKPHPPPLSSQRNEMLIFVLCSTSNDWPGWSMDSNPIHHPSPAKKVKCSFCITFNIWCWPDWSMDLNPIHHPSPAKKMKCFFLDYIQLLMIGRAGWWTQTPSTTPLQPIKWNASFWIMFTSDDQPGWLMDSNPICHPSPAKKMKCSFLYYVQLLMISQAGRWTQTPSATPLQPKKWNAHFCITFNFWCWPDWSMDSNPIHHPSPAKKWNAHFWIMFNFWWLAGLSDGLKPHPPSLSSQKMKCSFLDCVHFWWLAGLVDELEPHLPPSPAKKMKCSFFDYVQLLMISMAGQWTQTPSATPLQPIKWNAHFWIMFNFWWSARLVDGLKPHLPPLSSQKMKCSFLYYVQLLMISWAGRWTWTPSTTPLQPKNEMLIFVLHSTSDVGQTGQWTWTSSTIPLQPKKWNAHFWVMFKFWWLVGLFNELKPHLPPLSSQ